ncbi:MAG TPA: SRPBCC family protein [Bacteroidetes bacterium]|nr:SRPBCC family protein [Bacteroidota bacterium]
MSASLSMKIIRYTLSALFLLFLLLVLPGQFSREYAIHREIILHQPPEKVFNIIMNPFSFHQWIPGYKSIQPVAGKLTAPGSINRIILERNGKEMDVLQHIEIMDRPETLAATYELKNMQIFTHIEVIPVSDGTRMDVIMHLSVQGWPAKAVLFWTRKKTEKELLLVLENLQHLINGN